MATSGSFTLAVLISLLSSLVFLVSGWDALWPEFVSIPLIEARESASPSPSVVEDLRRSFPVATVLLDDGSLTVIQGGEGEASLREVRPVLWRHGYTVKRFTIGRDLAPHRLVERLFARPGWGSLLLLSTPLALLFVAFIALRLAGMETGLARLDPRRDLLAGGLGGVALVAVGAGLASTLGFLGWSVREQPVVGALLSVGGNRLWVVVAFLVLLAPVAEELFFRSWIFGVLLDSAGAPAAYGVSALLFALIHFHWVATPLYVVYGLGLAHLYRRRRSLWPPLLAHAVVNAVAVAAFLVGGP